MRKLNKIDLLIDAAERKLFKINEQRAELQKELEELKQQRQKLADQLQNIPENEERVIVATGRYLGEGFDDSRLDTLFLTLPISWKGTLSQYTGRLHRSHDMKEEVIIYDYADLNVPMLARMYARRLHGYRSIGYEVKEYL